MSAWPTVQSKSETVRGIGICKWTSEGGLKVKLENQDAVVTIAKDKIPVYMIGKKAITTVKMSFSLNGKKDTIYSAYPAKGEFIVKFEGWALGKDEKLATPKRQVGDRTNKDGQSYHYDYQSMTANLVVTEGDFKDIVIPYFLRYLYMEMDYDGKKVAAVKTSSKSVHAPKLLEFMEATGLTAEDDLPPFSDNVLPFLQQHMLAKDKTFKVIMKNGWVETVLGSDDVDLNPEIMDEDFGEGAEDEGDK